MLRRLPALAPTWPWVVDRLRVVDATAAVKTDEAAGWQRCVLRYDREVLTVSYRPITGSPRMRLERAAAGEWHWEARFDLSEANATTIAGVWHLAVGDAPAQPPSVAIQADRLVIESEEGRRVEFDLAVMSGTAEHAR